MLMKRLYKHCQTCGGLTDMGEFCSDLKGIEKENTIEYLVKKHQVGDRILSGATIPNNKIGRNTPREWPPQPDPDTYLKIQKDLIKIGYNRNNHR
jgi:hypothetical protein